MYTHTALVYIHMQISITTNVLRKAYKYNGKKYKTQNGARKTVYVGPGKMWFYFSKNKNG